MKFNSNKFSEQLSHPRLSPSKGKRQGDVKATFNEAADFDLAEEVFGTPKMMAFLKVLINSVLFFSLNEYSYIFRNLPFVTHWTKKYCWPAGSWPLPM